MPSNVGKRRLLPLAVLLLGSQAWGQVLPFADDFESGGLVATDMPPGRWSAVYERNASVTVRTSSAAARAGALGLRISDASPGNGEGEEGTVHLPIPPQMGDLWIRFWIRLPSHPNDLYITPLVIHAEGGASTSLYSAFIDYPGLQIGFNGFDVSGQLESQPNVRTLTPGQWHRIDAVVRGIGTSSGLRELYVDGDFAGQTLADLSGMRLTGFKLGLPWGARAWTGIVDFDDVEVAAAIPPELMSPADGGQSDGGEDAGSDAGVDAGVESGNDAGQVMRAPHRLSVGVGCGLAGTSAALPFAVLCAAILFRRRRLARTMAIEQTP